MYALESLNELRDSALQATVFAKQLPVDCERLLGPGHPDTLGTRNNLANTYRAACKPAEAIPLHQQALADRERVLDPDHPDTIAARNDLATAVSMTSPATSCHSASFSPILSRVGRRPLRAMIIR
jgi:hypothetical protein